MDGGGSLDGPGRAGHRRGQWAGPGDRPRPWPAAGAHVAIADIDATGSETTRALVSDAGGSADVVALDVTDDDSRRRVVAGAVRPARRRLRHPGQRRRHRPARLHHRHRPRRLPAGAGGELRGSGLPDQRVHEAGAGPPGGAHRRRRAHPVVSLSAITSGSGAIAYNGSRPASCTPPSASSGSCARRRSAARRQRAALPVPGAGGRSRRRWTPR